MQIVAQSVGKFDTASVFCISGYRSFGKILILASVFASEALS